MMIMNHEVGKEVAIVCFKVLSKNLFGRSKITKSLTKTGNISHIHRVTVIVINYFVFPCILLNGYHMKMFQVKVTDVNDTCI
jgi:hypothetical protein